MTGVLSLGIPLRSEMSVHQRILFLIQNLGGRVLNWDAAFWRNGGSGLQDYLMFSSMFKMVFDFLDQGKNSSTRLLQPQQGTESAAEYSIDLRIIAADSGWNEPALTGLSCKLSLKEKRRWRGHCLYYGAGYHLLNTWDPTHEGPFP